MDYSKIITIEPDKRSGKPCIRGLRMTVTDVLEYLAGGMTPEEIVDEFPDLTLEDIRACLAFAADSEKRTASGRQASWHRLARLGAYLCATAQEATSQMNLEQAPHPAAPLR